MTQAVRYNILGSDVCVLQSGHRRLKKKCVQRGLALVLYCFLPCFDSELPSSMLIRLLSQKYSPNKTFFSPGRNIA
jgi:hypothetical protein